MPTALEDRPAVGNRSVPADTVLPHVIYQDVAGALTWLNTAFGFMEHYRYGEPGEPVQGAQMRAGDAWIMLGVARDRRASPTRLGGWTQCLTLFVADVEAHLARARAAGARIVEELNETPYGEWQYAAEDPEGHRWLFARHARNVSPDEWGATVSDAQERNGELPGRRPPIKPVRKPSS